MKHSQTYYLLFITHNLNTLKTITQTIYATITMYSPDQNPKSIPILKKLRDWTLTIDF
jgi:hypothetical protein